MVRFLPALLALALLLPCPAFADAIGPPPDTCPPGAVGESSHEGAWCQPSTCSTDGHCPDGSKCREGVGLCVSQQEVPCGGLYPPELEPCTTTLIEAHGSCTTDSDCTRGTCQTAPRCVPDWNPVAKVKKGCGCSVQPTGSGLGAALLLGLGLALRLRLRRRR